MTAEATIEFDVPATMRDGTVLLADVFRPAGDGPWPVVLVRTPYGKQYLGTLAYTAVRRGFLTVLQDVRGRFASGGEWEPLTNEEYDGYDTVRWAAALPGSSGAVGMLGASYLGNTQWMAAVARPPELAAIVPSVTWSEPLDGPFMRGGALELGIMANWSLLQGIDTVARRWRHDVPELGRRLHALVADIDALASSTYWELPPGEPPSFARNDVPHGGFVAAVHDPAAADTCRVAGRQADTDVAAFHVGGWYDIFLQGTLDNHMAMVDAGRPSKLLVGPWPHAVPFPHQVGEVNFGFAANAGLVDLRRPLVDLELDWLDRWLTGRTPAADEAPVRLFVMGVNRWRDEDAWPLARAVDTGLHLRAGGGLTREAPGRDEPADTYVFDPADPVPTHGGALLMASDFRQGPLDQARVERRPDVLVFTAEPLPDDLEVTGRVSVRLYASTDAPSTDWVARLCDVDASGVSRNVTDGVVRVSATPGEVGEHVVDLWSTSIVFRAGHRIRVQVTSSNFPRWDRNPNTGESPRTATTSRPAHQTVHHDAARRSRVVLPVVPSRAGGIPG
ncbi:MAG: CocE/NonD family hydrolase [Acidothermales bacterium]|nr:CocE/NonD family hydrolase [Acidothermales bacterium]